ncbi:UNVERIFIED_CONTAM: hypothetical protein Sradi_1906900 [Sesamum radiatum]|uniref:Uncharacterized protein n=1 Tax=Sesamum radiatum TaxID=300843 RepID=A0AAW2TZJ1_SESRA
MAMTQILVVALAAMEPPDEAEGPLVRGPLAPPWEQGQALQSLDDVLSKWIAPLESL